MNSKEISGLMAKGTQDQFSRTDMVATAMHEMSATAQNVAENAASAAQATDQADHTAHEGEQVMQDTIGGIAQMGKEIDNTAGVIKQLDEDSRRIRYRAGGDPFHCRADQPAGLECGD